ncbi:MAG: hypothetical protein H7145_09360 [Akkermansiaceae bacterium]|nr:hypothetical protein [Armatimonadota bacterium]
MSTREDSREKPLDPVMSAHEHRKDSIEGQTLKEQLAQTNLPGEHADQHHGESTKAAQDEKNIGQHNGAGRPPLMKK